MYKYSQYINSVFQNMGLKMSDPGRSNSGAFGLNPKVRGSSFPRLIFCLKSSDNFQETLVRASKMNVAVHTQFAFQMLTLNLNYLYRRNKYSKTQNMRSKMPDPGS